MAQTIFTNMASLNTQRHLNSSQSALSQSLERLSSGKRINSAKDDAAGLAIAERMTAQIQGMNQAIKNANDGISLSQTAEGALDTSLDMIERIRVLAVQSSNATNSASDRQALQDEVNELTAELNRIATTTQFNRQNILDGTMGAQVFQVGANANETITTVGSNFQTHVYGNNRIYSEIASASATGYGGTLTVNGRYGSATTSTLAANSSALAMAKEINAITDRTGVSASAKTEVLLGGLTAGSHSLGINSNNALAADIANISFTIGTDLTSADSYAEAVNAINAQSSKTGVIAEYYTGMDDDSPPVAIRGIKLTNATGENISLTGAVALNGSVMIYDQATDTGTFSSTAVALAPAGVRFIGTVTMDSISSFSLTDGTTATFFDTSNSTLKAVQSLDVTSFGSSQLALAICDAAIDVINAERARYGALQTRFEAVISNLEINAENTSNARSRIEDADYAEETANMSRATILQQAGIAMLTQANQIPQMVLSLIG